jgi:hypothetical protein
MIESYITQGILFEYPKTNSLLSINNNKPKDVMTTTEMIESLRKKRTLEYEIETFKILSQLKNKEIDFENDKVWDSLRNGLLKGSDLLDIPIDIYISSLLNEYENGYVSAKKEILNLGRDPLKQNISEEVQQEVAKNNGILLKKLPQSGKNSFHVYDGNVVQGEFLSKDEKELSSKALDFLVENTEKIIYTYNKYNKWVGGSTDDVFKDVRNLIKEIKKIENKQLYFFIILDGYYWDLNRESLQKYNDDNLCITNSDELNEKMLNIL